MHDGGVTRFDGMDAQGDREKQVFRSHEPRRLAFVCLYAGVLECLCDAEEGVKVAKDT